MEKFDRAIYLIERFIDGVMLATISLLIGGAIGLCVGLVEGHGAAATECERLGGFFVKDKVYECRVKEAKP